VSDATENGREAGKPGMLPPGAQLQAARERAGWTLERLAAELVLPPNRLQALEQDDHSSFGGVVFVRGYLRRAAAVLGVPPGELITAFEACCDGVKPAEIPPGLAPGLPPRRDASAGSALVLGAIAIAAAAAGTWWVTGPGGAVTPASRGGEAPLIAKLEFSVPVEEAPVAAPPPPAALAEDAAAELAPEAVAATVEESLRQAATTPEFTVVEVPEPAAPPPGTVELRFEFTEECWLEVTDAEDRRLAYRLYRPGDVARLRGTAPVSVFLGNAEGVRLTVDGAALALRPAARRDGTARLTVGGGAG
jgi:cytoskeleton protein RodZ